MTRGPGVSECLSGNAPISLHRDFRVVFSLELVSTTCCVLFGASCSKELAASVAYTHVATSQEGTAVGLQTGSSE